MVDGPNQAVLSIRRTTYLALKRLREDMSYPTYDQLIVMLIEWKYPGRSEV